MVVQPTNGFLECGSNWPANITNITVFFFFLYMSKHISMLKLCMHVHH